MRSLLLPAVTLLAASCHKSTPAPAASQAPAPAATAAAPAAAPAPAPAAAAPPAPSASTSTLAVGDKAPAFALPGTDGKVHRLADDLAKGVVVLAWYPKAFTGG